MMKKLFYIATIWLFCFAHIVTINAQNSMTDTVKVAGVQEAMELTFGLLPKSHYPSGYLFTKAPTIPKLQYANGQLNDSSFNMLEFYLIQNHIKMSYLKPDSMISFLRIDSIKNKYVEQYNTLPFGLVDITGQYIKDSAFISAGLISVSNHRLVEATNNVNSIYGNKKLFCASPLNLEVNTLNPQFILKQDNVYSNNTHSITSIQIDLDDGLGLKNIDINVPFQASYTTGGFKQFLTIVVYNNGDTLYSRSELNVISVDLAKLSSVFQVYDETFKVEPFGPNASNYGSYPTEFTPSLASDSYAEVGIWYGCYNFEKK